MLKLKRKTLRIINDLARIANANKDERISEYLIQISTKNKKLYVEEINSTRVFSLFVQANLEDTKNLNKLNKIPIYDSEFLNESLSVLGSPITITIKDNFVHLEAKGGSKMPTIKYSKKSLEDKQLLCESFFENKNYGENDNLLILYEEPDCKLTIPNLNDLKIGRLSKISSDIAFSVSKGTLTIGSEDPVKKNGISVEINNGEKGIEIEGNIDNYIPSNINPIRLLEKFEGKTVMLFKDSYPLLVKKKIGDDIGVSYVLTPTLDESEFDDDDEDDDDVFGDENE